MSSAAAPQLKDRRFTVRFLGRPWAWIWFAAMAAPAALGPSVRAVVGSLASDAAIADMQTMDELVARGMAEPRLYVILLVSFAAVALALAALGIYGVVSYAVSRRTREVGIRMSLGATHTTVIRTLMGGGLKLVAIGGAIGLVLSIALSRLLGGLLFGVESFDLFSFTLVPVVLLVATLLAAWIPARRATRIDPVRALRAE